MNGAAMLVGMLVGAAVGAVTRGGFTYWNLAVAEHNQELVNTGLSLVALLPSAGIGGLCGAVSGATCHPLIGAGLGAFLSAAIFALLLLPFAILSHYFGAEKELVDFSAVYFIQRAIAGAIAGGAGGFAGQMAGRMPKKRHFPGTARPQTESPFEP